MQTNFAIDQAEERISLLKLIMTQIDSLPITASDKSEMVSRLALTETKVLRDILEGDCFRLVLEHMASETSPYLQ